MRMKRKRSLRGMHQASIAHLKSLYLHRWKALVGLLYPRNLLIKVEVTDYHLWDKGSLSL
jgi:hypothetical protein